ncbi:TPA: hypothetical protein ACHIGK_001738 [Streptococcus pyogenes]
MKTKIEIMRDFLKKILNQLNGKPQKSLDLRKIQLNNIFGEMLSVATVLKTKKVV